MLTAYPYPTFLKLHDSSHLLSPDHKWAHPLLIFWSEGDEEEFADDVDEYCWGPSASEGPQKHDLTMFSKRNM
jgi:hypothetical protein